MKKLSVYVLSFIMLHSVWCDKQGEFLSVNCAQINQMEKDPFETGTKITYINGVFILVKESQQEIIDKCNKEIK